MLSAGARATRMLVLVVGGAMLADLIWHLPAWLRAGWLLTSLWLLFTLLTRRFWPAYALTMDDRDLARLVEARRHELDGALIGAVAGQRLSAADQQRLAALQAPLVQELVPARQLPAALAVAAATVLVVVIVATLWPAQVGLAALRFATPWVERPWPRADAITMAALPAAVAADEPVVIQVERTSGSSSALSLTWTSEDGRRGQSIQNRDDGRWQLSLDLPPGRYQVEAGAGDAVPVQATLAVRRRPQLSAIDATLTPPAYVGSGSEALATLAVEALPGSRIDFAVAVEDNDARPVAEVAARLDGEPISLEQRDGRWYAQVAIVDQPRDLEIQASDEAGIAMHPVTYRMRVRPDQPPVVRLSGPRPGEAVLPGATLRLRVQANDDIGLASVAVESRLPDAGDDATFNPAEDLGTALGRSCDREVALSVPSAAAAGSALQLRARAADGDTINGPHEATSAVLSLRVVTEPELRRELERGLAAERDRIDQARSAWQQDLADGDQAMLGDGRDSLASQGKRIVDGLERLRRRWLDNKLAETDAEAIAAATTTMRSEVLGALPELTAVADGQAVDAALERAYRTIDGLLSAGDLRRDLGQLIEQQEAVAEATKQQVRDVILGRQDAGSLGETAQRQRELSERLQDWERRLLQDPEHKEDPVAAAVSRRSAARSLQQAAAALEDGNSSQQAVSEQRDALEAMRQWYDDLQDQDGDGSGQSGNQQQQALMEELAALVAAHQEVLAKLEEGQPTTALLDDWSAVRTTTETFATAIAELGNEQALLIMNLLAKQQGDVTRSLGDGRGEAAEAGLHACLASLEDLRAALQQQAAGGSDLMTAIKDLHGRQQAIVVATGDLLQRQEKDDLSFRDRQHRSGLADEQSAIGAALREQIRPQIADDAIVVWAVDQALVAIDAAAYAFGKQADGLRRRHEDLARGALVALSRLIDVGDQGADFAGGNTGGGQGGGEQQQTPPYPPRAALNMLRQAQERLARQTMTLPSPHALEDQDALMQMIEPLLGSTRPGTRPAQLLERCRVSMDQAIAAIVRQEGAPGIAAWQRAAVGDIEQLLAEMRMQMSQPSGGQGQQQQDNQQQQDQQQSPSTQSDQQQTAGSDGQGDANSAGEAAQGLSDEQKDWLMQLQPLQRQRLLEAVGAGVPPEGLELYRRYMDLLEERLP